MNAKNHFFVRGNLQKDTAAGDENLPGQAPAYFTDDNTKGISAGHTWIPTPHIVNDARYGYIRQGYQTGGIAPGEWVDIYGLTQPTAQTGSNLLHVPVNNITDTLSWNKGQHTFAFGGNWRGITNHHSGNTNSFNSASTTYEYANTGDLPLPANMAGGFGNAWQLAYADIVGDIPQLSNVYDYTITGPTTGVALPQGAPVTKNFHSNQFEGYVQDTWHARPNLTVTYGVRYTLLQTPYETNGQQIAPTIDTDAWYQKRESAAQQGQIYEPVVTLAPAGKANHAPGYWPVQKKGFAPRLGVVFAPTQKPPFAPAPACTSTTTARPWSTPSTPTGPTASPPASATPQTCSASRTPRASPARTTCPTFRCRRSRPPRPSPLLLRSTASTSTGASTATSRLLTPSLSTFPSSMKCRVVSPLKRLTSAVLVTTCCRNSTSPSPPTSLTPAVVATILPPPESSPKRLMLLPSAPSSTASLPAARRRYNNVAAIPYFENVFPYMKNQDYMGESATQAMFNNAWAPERYTNGETLALAIADVFGIFPGSPNYAPGSQGSTFWASQFSSLYSLDSVGNSSYNALQFTVRHPASHGLTVDFSYTFSKSLDLGSETERSNIFSNVDNGFTNFAIQNTWNPKLNKGVSDFDTHSLLTTDWVYSLPVGRGKAALSGINRVADAFIGGWQWAGLSRWTSGLPFTIESPAYPTNYDNPAMTFNTGGVKTHRSIINGIPHAIDPAVATNIGNGIYFGNPIRLPYAGEAGNRNTYRGDGYIDIDSAVSKSWNMGDWAKLKFAAEAYNITNSVRFDTSLNGLVASSASPNLGTYDAPLSTYRRMQFGLRVDF